MSNNQAILEFEIVLNVKASEQTKQTMKDLEAVKRTVHEARQQTKDKGQNLPQYYKNPLANFTAQPGAVREFQETQKEQQQIKKETLDFLQKLDNKGLQTLSSFATNPTGASLNALKSALTAVGADASILLGVVGIAITAPVVITQLIQALSVKGGPLNRDWRRYLGKEVDVGLSRMQVVQKEQGVDVVSIAQRLGFGPNNQNWVYNSLFAIDDKRIARIGLGERAAGIYTS